MFDGVARSDDGGGRLGKDHRLLGQVGRGVQRAAGFRHVLHIVQADAEDVLARPRDRRQQLHVFLRQCGAHRPVAAVGLHQPAGLRDCHGAQVNDRQQGVGQPSASAPRRAAAVG
ncbi:hypothetical protein G6F24_017644 [Rhizopus arrhizus]|nr:hypothetical protein G6F24_017644 [Rhizopus arrhizus]